MLNQNQTKIIKCSDIDLTNYRIQMIPNLDIAYFYDNVPYNPILETDWIKVDADDVTNAHVHIPNDLRQSSIDDLVCIMNHVESMMYSVYNYPPNPVLYHPTIMTDRMKQRGKLKIPFIKPLPSIELFKLQSQNDGPIEIKFIGSFNVNSMTDMEHDISYLIHYIEFSILDIDVRNIYNEDHLTNDIDNLSLMVTI